MSSSVIRGVIFDLGSTLIDFKGDYAEVLPESLGAIADHFLAKGVDLNRDAFIHALGLALGQYHDRRDSDHIEHTTYSILQEVLVNHVEPLPAEAVLRDGLTAMYAVSEAHWKPKPAMQSVLQELSGNGFKLGLLSNAGDEANVQRLIDSAGIRGFFDPILISAALGIRKPDPRPFQLILQQWALTPDAVVMVGDLLEADILGAQRAGLHSIWLAEGDDHAPSADPVGPQPECIARDLGEIPELIKRISTKG